MSNAMHTMWDAIDQYWRQLQYVAVVWVLVAGVVSALHRRRSAKPIVVKRPDGTMYLEKWVSGRSRRNLITRMGAARNCLMVAVTSEQVVVHPLFPFNLFFLPDIYDLDHEIPLGSIRSVGVGPGWLRKVVTVEYDLTSGGTRLIDLRLRRPIEFLESIGRTT